MNKGKGYSIKIFILLLLCFSVEAQTIPKNEECIIDESNEQFNIPASLLDLGASPLEDVSKITLPPMDNNKLLERDVLARKKRINKSKGNEAAPDPVYIAEGINVNIDPEHFGTWEFLNDGTLLWRLRIHSPGATIITLGFEYFHMPSCARLFIYSTNYEYIRGPYTEKDNKYHYKLWTPMIPIDEVVVELNILPENSSDIILHLDSVQHGYKEFCKKPTKITTPCHENSSWCNIDVGCIGPGGNQQLNDFLPEENPYWPNQARSVGLMAVHADRTTLCSGALINNTALDGVPYFLTASHCLRSLQRETGEDEIRDEQLNLQDLLDSIIVYWRYYYPGCRDFTDNTTNESQGSGGHCETDYYTNGGAVKRAEYEYCTNDWKQHDPPLCTSHIYPDILLLELNNRVDDIKLLFFSGWDAREESFEKTVVISHPRGEVQRISIEEQEAQPVYNGWDLKLVDVWDMGLTEPGSSGSPWFNPYGRIYGVHSRSTWEHIVEHYEEDPCDPNKTTPLDVWAGSLSKSWAKLRNYLDPIGVDTEYYRGMPVEAICTPTEIKNTNYPPGIHMEDHCAIITGPNVSITEDDAIVSYDADYYIILNEGFRAESNDGKTYFHAESRYGKK